jgi:hypothetical protein
MSCSACNKRRALAIIEKRRKQEDTEKDKLLNIKEYKLKK